MVETYLAKLCGNNNNCSLYKIPFPPDFCRAYEVDPSGVGDFDYTDDQTDICYNQINNNGRCQLCLHRQSRDALRCLQHHILVQNTVSL